MIKQQLQIAEYISRYISETITPEEEAELKKWRDESLQNEQLFQKLCDKQNLENYLRESCNYDKEEGWEKFSHKKLFLERRKRFVRFAKYAAIFLLPVVLGVWSVTTLIDHEETIAQQVMKNPIQIVPGDKKAVLTLGNGEKVELLNPTEKLMEEKDGTFISIDSAAINYQLAQTNTPVEEEIYNTVDIPHGGEYSLTLSDGTKVYLNSMSTLRFPVRFIGDKRVVELTGEAYFEVSKNTSPFIVKVNNMEIEVLGTAFNVSAYKGETHHATLINGAVKVHLKTGDTCVLKPSEQAYVKPGSDNLNVREVDVAQYVSWVNGKIYFKDERLEDIMNTLSRWYDMQIFYPDPSVKDLRFGCNINRYKDITPFLELLEKTEKVDIVIKGNTITFKHNN